MAGKYAKVIDKLPRMLGTEPDYQVKVDAVKEVIKEEEGFKMWSSHLAKLYAMARLEKSLLNQQLYVLNVRIEALGQMIETQFDNESVSKINLQDGMSVTYYKEPTVKVIDAEAFRVWCIDNGFEKMMHLHPMRTISLAKEKLLSPEPDLPGVTVGSMKKIKFSAGGGKEDDWADLD